MAEGVEKIIVDGDGGEDASAPEPVKKSKKDKAKQVIIKLEQRKGKKMNTIIVGLDAFNVDLKEASKTMKKKFACGVGVSRNAEGKDEIEIQGTFIEESALLIMKEHKLPEEAFVLVVAKVRDHKVNATVQTRSTNSPPPPSFLPPSTHRVMDLPRSCRRR